VVWHFDQTDAPDFPFRLIQNVYRLKNGNILFASWFNQWNDVLNPHDYPLQAIEVTPDKRVAWALQSWVAPAALGPATTIQILDDANAAPEDVRFGDIH
jgi:hypothetical protein